ncbi:MAG: hypothetical protein OEV91_09120 [Desulfobulbaceae bacterium]|nr:hypothetical protein [Desulfobulbaceae bacterium]
MKMASSTALLFPDTMPTWAATTPLLLLFSAVTQYRPTESNRDLPPPVPAAPGLCRSHAPLPLGDDLDRFLRLVKDLRGHAAEYYGSFLSTLSPGGTRFQEESVQQVIAAMTRGSATAPTPAAVDETIWQARLLLQLAEELHREEAELALHLAKVAAMQQQMLHSLRGDDEEEEEEEEEELALPGVAAEPARSPIRTTLLCRAWSRLFVADRQPGQPEILATANSEAAELVLDTYAKLRNAPPATLCRLPLPCLTGMDEEGYLGRRAAFRAGAADTLTALFTAMEEAMENGQAPGAHWSQLADQWTTAVAAHFSGTTGGGQLEITLLPGVSLTTLCGQMGRTGDEQGARPARPHGLMVHVTTT